MEICFVYGCNHKSLWERCKFYRFRIRAVYTCTRPCTSRVHGRVPAVNRADGLYVPCTPVTKPCIRVVNSAVYTAVHDRTGRVHVCMAVYTAVCVHGLVCTRPYTRPVHGRVRTVNTGREHLNTTVYMAWRRRVHGRVQAVYTTVYWPCIRLCTRTMYRGTRPVHDLYSRVRCLYAKQQTTKHCLHQCETQLSLLVQADTFDDVRSWANFVYLVLTNCQSIR